MAVLTNPSRAQFQRFTATGEAPTIGQPGSLAVNIPDRKLWTFDPLGEPQLVSHLLRTHDPARAYAEGDVVIQSDTLWEAATNLTPRAFNPSDWRRLAAEDATPPPEPSASGISSGGILTAAGGAGVQVSAGSGTIVNTDTPNAPTRTDVTWGTTTVTATPGSPTRVISVGSNGAVQVADIAALSGIRRNRIVLGYAVLDEAGNVQTVRNVPRVKAQSAQDLGDLIGALGGSFIVNGARLEQRSGRTLKLSSGACFALGARWRANKTQPNTVTVPGADPLSFDVVRANGEVLETGAENVPNMVYEAGPMPAGFCVNHFLFATPDMQEVWLQVGAELHTDISRAAGSLERDWAALNSPLKTHPFVVLLGAVTLIQGATDLALQGLVAAAAPGPAAGNRFLSAADSGGFMRTDGSTPMMGTLDMNGNPINNAVIGEGTF